MNKRTKNASNGNFWRKVLNDYVVALPSAVKISRSFLISKLSIINKIIARYRKKDITSYICQLLVVSTHSLTSFPSFSGITGILLVLALLTMYICATQYARRYLHRWFWNTHQLYPLVLGLMVLHGAGRLLQVGLY